MSKDLLNFRISALDQVVESNFRQSGGQNHVIISLNYAILNVESMVHG
jgi:hypothetical protein